MNKNRLKKLIGPLLLEQLFGVSVGLIDTFMVSRVGEAAVSGVALVDNINTLVIQVMAAFAAGGIVVISQYLGDNNSVYTQKTCAHLETLLVGFSLCIMAIYVFGGKYILGGLFSQIESDVMSSAMIYMTVSGVSLVFWGMYTAGSAILRSQENTRTSMYVSLIMNIMNVVLNAIFVFILHMGVLGVAVATLISRAFAGIIMKFVLLSDKNTMKISDRRLYMPEGKVYKNILSMGIPSGIENGMFHVGKLIVVSMLATLGTAAIAANTIAYQIIEFPNIPGNTIGMATVVIVGQDIGAGEKEKAVSDTKYLLKLAYIGDWICKLILFAAAPVIVNAFSLSSQATDIAVLVLRCFSVVSLFIWPLSYTLPNALRGAGDVRYSMIVSVLSMWLGRVAVSYILIRHFELGILGVWLGMFADWFIRGGGYYARFRSGKWLNKKIV